MENVVENQLHVLIERKKTENEGDWNLVGKKENERR